jgi:methanogen homocitrate synthase
MSSHEHLERGPWRGEKWWVTHFNYVDEVVSQFSFPSRIFVHDVTLRDGEQTPGVVLRTEEKVEIARALDEAGVDRIEAGMPVVSEEDLEAIRRITRLGLSAKVFGFGRIRTEDIDACLKADVDGVITEGPVGYPKLKYQFGWSPEQLFESAVKAIDYAKDHGLVTIFFTVDGTRADLGFLTELLQRLERETKVDGFTIADTYGSLTPEGARFLFRHLKSKLTRPLEFHGHNDFGLATATSIAALSAGAEVVHVSVNGIGERAGNASLEEVVLSLHLLYGQRTGIRLEKLHELSRLVERLTGFKVAPNKAVVGERVFTRESGIGVAGWLKYPLGSEAFSPELVGNRPAVLIGKKSGKHALEYKLRELGISRQLTEEQLEAVLREVKRRSLEKKGPLTDEEFVEIVNSVVVTV